LLFAVAVAFGGCSGSGNTQGSGGRPGSGGALATGGTSSASGGAPGSGGSLPGTGGAASGGAPGSGGAASGSGGAPSGTGGAASGGAPGSGGAAGAGTGGGANTGGRAGGAGQGGGSTGGSSGGTGGAGGGAAFAPCPATGNCVIMPFGDSITDGFGTPGGYRIELFRTALMNNRRLTFAGRNMNGPETVMVGTTTTNFPKGHEGYSGYTIDPSSRSGVSPLADAAITAAKPHIILLMIGTNDIDLSVDVATAPMRLGALLDKVTADAPNALVVLAKITPLQDDTVNARVRTYNDAMPALVQSRVAAGKHIVLVDMYAPFTANASYKTALLADKWHPNPAGYQVMATVWYDAIKGVLR